MNSNLENIIKLSDLVVDLVKERNTLQKKLNIATETLNKLKTLPYKSPEPYYQDLAKDALDDIEKIK